MDCDPLASIYRSLEFIAFAKGLEEQRFRFLDKVRDARRALLLGEGDGRFALELAKRNIHVEIDCVDASGKMIELAKQRLRDANVPSPDRIRFEQCDARQGGWHGNSYDLVVTHFFLDCFSDAEVDTLIPAIRGACRPGAKWLVADFQEPEKGWRCRHARCWLATMYRFFRLTTGLQVQRLPDYRKALREAGFLMRDCRLTRAQLICSELWEWTYRG